MSTLSYVSPLLAEKRLAESSATARKFLATARDCFLGLWAFLSSSAVVASVVRASSVSSHSSAGAIPDSWALVFVVSQLLSLYTIHTGSTYGHRIRLVSAIDAEGE